MKAGNKVCAFTGHRPSKLPWRYDETDRRRVALKAVLAEQIVKLAQAGFMRYLFRDSGGSTTPPGAIFTKDSGLFKKCSVNDIIFTNSLRCEIFVTFP